MTRGKRTISVCKDCGLEHESCNKTCTKFAVYRLMREEFKKEQMKWFKRQREIDNYEKDKVIRLSRKSKLRKVGG